MRKTGLTLLWIAILAITALSQQPVVEPGRALELKGVTRVYVSTSNSDARTSISAEIRTQLPQLTIAERSEDADVWLLFSAKRRSFSKTDPISTFGSSRSMGTSLEYEIVASGSVIKPVTKESARRLIEFSDKSETNMSFPERALGLKFAKAFVKAYRKANP
jgi:hypothetical protein